MENFTVEQTLAFEAVKQLMPKFLTGEVDSDSKLIVAIYDKYLNAIRSELSKFEE